MKIKFKNGIELNYTQAFETSEFYDNAQRRVLEVQMTTDTVGLDTLNTLLADITNLQEIVLNGDNGEVSIWNNYEIKMELAVKPVVIDVDANGAQIKQDRIVFKLGRLTPIEKQLKALGL